MESPVILNSRIAAVDTFTNDKLSLSSITPFRVALIDILYQYLQTQKSVDVPYLGLKWEQRVTLCLKFLHWIIGPDITYDQLKLELNEIKDEFGTYIFMGIGERYNDSECLVNLFKNVDKMLSGEKSSRSSNIDGQSPVGLFLRRHSLMFKNLTFMQVSKLWKCFEKYSTQDTEVQIKVEDSFDDILVNNAVDISNLSIQDRTNKNDIKDEMELGPSNFNSKFLFSKKQSEFFISKQISLLLQKDNSAMLSKDLQKVINHLLTNNSHQSEVLYLQYLNSLRARDYTVCLNSLIQYFDSKSNAIGQNVNNFATQSNDEIAKSFRFAALNLAIFHVEMGHWEIGEAAIKEAVRMALEANDMVCLQHSLMWMEIIKDELSEKLESNSFCSSLKNHISSVSSVSENADMTFRSWVQKMLQNGGTPIKLIRYIDSNASAYVESVLGESATPATCNTNTLTGTSLATQYVLQARAWKTYGFSYMASLYFQLALFSSQSYSSSISAPIKSQPESACIAITEMAGILRDFGSSAKYKKLIDFISKECVYDLSSSKHWRAVSAEVSCKDAVLRNDSKLLKVSSAELKMYAPRLSDVYYAKYKYALRNSTQSVKLLSSVLSSNAYADVKILAHCSLADIYFGCKEFSRAMHFHLLPALEMSNSLFLRKTAAEIEARIAVCHFMLGDSDLCLKTMEKLTKSVLTESDFSTRIQTMCWFCKCLMRDFNSRKAGLDGKKLKSNLEFIGRIIRAIEYEFGSENKAETVFLRKEVITLKTFLCQLMGRKQESFDLAKQFNSLHEECKSDWPKFILS